MRLSRQRCIYAPRDEWERIRRRARKAKLPISRFGYLCCQRAVEEEAGSLSGLRGHPLVLTEAEQGRLARDALVVLGSERSSVPGPEGVEVLATVRKVARFLRLAHEEDGV